MNNLEQKINTLARPNIRSLRPYSSARDEAPPAPDGKKMIYLDANENSLGGPLEEDYSRYPDPHQGRLKTALAARKGIQPEQIFIGNGSDEAIDLLLRAFCEPGRDNIVLLPPTYGMYAVQAAIQGLEIRRAPLRPDFSPDVAALQAAVDERSKLLFLCSPNNPTAQCLPDEFILETLGDFPGLVVLDEAYVDFSEKPSWASRLADYPNLVVLQTLSKAWGLAGLRVGFAYANPFIINILNKIKYPYNLSAATISLALEALQREAAVREKVGLLRAARARLNAELSKIACIRQVFPSDANFLLVRVNDADGLYAYLSDCGIIVRNRSREMHCGNCLRITVGAPEENERLLEAMRRYGHDDTNK